MIRKAIYSDIKNILELQTLCGLDIHSEESLDKLILENNNVLLVNEDSHKIVSFLALLLHKGHHYGRIKSLFIHPRYQAKCLSGVLLIRAEEASQNVMGVKVDLKSDNPHAIKAFKNMGYKIISQVFNYYAPNIHCVEMRKEFTKPWQLAANDTKKRKWKKRA